MLRPPTHRSTLSGPTSSMLIKRKVGGWSLTFPAYYAHLFESYFPALMAKCPRGFRDSILSEGKKEAVFPRLEERDLTRIQSFITFFSQAVCLGINRHFGGKFQSELDFCIALDWNRPDPRSKRTQIGEWEYQAKYDKNQDALVALVGKLVPAMRALPLPLLSKPRLLTYVPSGASKAFYLPSRLAEEIVMKVPASFWGTREPLLKPILRSAKRSAKNMSVTDKIAHWDKMLQAKEIKLSQLVRGCSVIVLDDLYQSGTSMWSFAKYLKAEGAAVVVGLACVKSLRDTDNL
jgi:hypothetical protein